MYPLILQNLFAPFNFLKHPLIFIFTLTILKPLSAMLLSKGILKSDMNANTCSFLSLILSKRFCALLLFFLPFSFTKFSGNYSATHLQFVWIWIGTGFGDLRE